ncbi:hypothetical protein GQ457_16G006710 [Hibiscus cannabinus]
MGSSVSVLTTNQSGLCADQPSVNIVQTSQDESVNSSYNNRGRGRGRTSSRPQCQLCGRLGHLVDRCYYRYDMSFKNESSRSAQVPPQHFAYNAFLQLVSQTPSHVAGFPPHSVRASNTMTPHMAPQATQPMSSISHTQYAVPTMAAASSSTSPQAFIATPEVVGDNACPISNIKPSYSSLVLPPAPITHAVLPVHNSSQLVTDHNSPPLSSAIHTSPTTSTTHISPPLSTAVHTPPTTSTTHISSPLATAIHTSPTTSTTHNSPPLATSIHTPPSTSINHHSPPLATSIHTPPSTSINHHSPPLATSIHTPSTTPIGHHSPPLATFIQTSPTTSIDHHSPPLSTSIHTSPTTSIDHHSSPLSTTIHHANFSTVLDEIRGDVTVKVCDEGPLQNEGSC